MLRRTAGLLVLTLALFAPALQADEAGRALAQKLYDRPDGQDAVTLGTMTLLESGGSPRVRQMQSFALKKSPTVKWSMLRFTAPEDIKNTGLLTKDNPDAETDQWVYLPALGTTRRIPGNRKGGNFVGSDLYYEDLQDREVPEDEHTIIGSEKIQGVDCPILQSIPVNPDNSVYTKRVSWVHPQILIPLKIEFYQGKPTPVKRLEVLKVAKIQGFWTVMESRMTNLETGHQTLISVRRVVYDKGLPDSLFTQQTLEDPSRDGEWLK